MARHGRRGVCLASPHAATSLALPAHDGSRRRESVAVAEYPAAQHHGHRFRGRRRGKRGCVVAATRCLQAVPRPSSLIAS
jgi:hypothetical protein